MIRQKHERGSENAYGCTAQTNFIVFLEMIQKRLMMSNLEIWYPQSYVLFCKWSGGFDLVSITLVSVWFSTQGQWTEARNTA